MPSAPAPMSDKAAAVRGPPAGLASRRRERYRGDGVPATLEELGPAGTAVLSAYSAAGVLLERLRASLGVGAAGPGRGAAARDDAPAREVLRAAAHTDWFADAVRKLGSAEVPPKAGPRARMALHDARAGPFGSLAASISLAAQGRDEEGDGVRAYYLARDARKLMRAAVPDLDPAAAAADTLPKLHAVGLLVEKWQSALHRLPAGGPSARFEVECSLVGAVAERCVEFAALDGVIYACAAAAVRASIDGKVKLTISPVRPTDGRTAPDARFMFTTAASFSPDPAPLFMPGTGADNLALCAEMVGEAYGVDPEEAVEDGYVGAAVRGGALALWVHWPTA